MLPVRNSHAEEIGLRLMGRWAPLRGALYRRLLDLLEASVIEHEQLGTLALKRSGRPNYGSDRPVLRCVHGLPSSSSSAVRSLSGVAGKFRIRAPVALWMALITAAPAPQMPSSPMPLLPSGLPFGSSSCRKSTSISPTSAFTATW